MLTSIKAVALGYTNFFRINSSSRYIKVRIERLSYILILSLSVLIISLSCSTRPISEEEKGLLLQVKDLSQFNVIFGDLQTVETFKYTYYGAGEWEVKYTYDSPNSPDVTPLYLVSRVEFAKNENEAISTFNQGILAYKGGGMIGGLSIVEDPKLFQWGDKSFSAYLEKNGTRVGNLIVVRKGNRIFNVILSGLYFGNTEYLEQLLIPKLQKMVSFPR